MNSFTAFGEQHARRPRAPRAPVTDQEKRQAERNARMKRYRAAVAKERAEAYALPGGDEAKAIVRWAAKMTPEDGDTLLSKVRQLRPERLDKRLRARLLADLDDLIGRLRVRHGYAEIDDPLPGEEDSVFLVLRRMLG